MNRILLVEDDLSLIDGLEFSLQRNDFHVDVARTVKDAFFMIRAQKYDLLLLDLTLPDGSGFEICKKVRQSSAVPIIFLTASDEEVNIVMGLDIGGDDYVTKPFSIRELMARVKATLRRVQMQKKTPELLTCGDLTLDLGKMELKKGENRIELTYREFNLKAFLIKNAGYVFSREKLLEEVWDYEFIGDLRTVDVTIRRLREKVEADPGNPYYLCTKRGVGYYLRRP